MNLTLDNEINQNVTKENEITDFIDELKNSLENTDCRTATINDEILSEIDLAVQYKNNLNDIVEKCMENLSYDYDFLYCDYDKTKRSYFLDYYYDGEIDREYLTKAEMKEMNLQKGTFWRPYEDDSIVMDEDLKDNIKINVESELDLLDWNNKQESR
jgi:hypothetical protein